MMPMPQLGPVRRSAGNAVGARHEPAVICRLAGFPARATSILQGSQAVNIMRSITTTLDSLGRLAVLGACLALAACGSSQNWDNGNPNVTVGGTVTGFTGGTLALWNNGGDRLVIAGDGPFQFSLAIANGASYATAVATQPAGQTCTVDGGAGVATHDIKTVAVTCRPYEFARRVLPAIYSTGKAVNYSPYRTDGGPITGEVPSDSDVLQDLTLLHTAGFNLLRLFGVAPPTKDEVSEKILRIAAQYYPDMKFHLGISLHGLTSCSDTINDSAIALLITKLSKYPNVAAISVGNETSFYSKYMPVACLEGYVRNIRAQVTQPVTADDDFTFYAGKTAAGGDRVDVKPDTILALIDFASIHLYPISNPGWWDWMQAGTAPGPARAQAMMEASLVAAKNWFNEVSTYQYLGAEGVTVSVGASMPIVIGETGWKAVQTNSASEIEQYAALPVNAKWYYDLLYGNAGQGYASWQGSQGGPLAIFYFEATDETWKAWDDGWGLWDKNRTARYALCGSPAGPACNNNVYEGAGYYNPPAFSTITFDSASQTYKLTGFGGAEDSQVVADPANAANKVARVNRSGSAETWAGTTVSPFGNLTAGTIPFTGSDTQMTVRVYSPASGVVVRLKVEDAANAAHSVETDATTTVANGWETLTFNFAHQAAGTPALNPAYTYNKVSIFFDFGVAGAAAGARTYYFDDITFIGGGGGGGGGGMINGIYASNYSQIDAAHWSSTEGGDAGNYIDTGVATQYWWNGVAPGDATPSFYFGYGISINAKPWGFGAFVNAPGNGTADVSGFANVRISVWGNDELMNTHPSLTVILKGPSVAGCASELKGTISVTANGVQTYTLALNAFTLQTACAYASAAAALAAGVNEIHIQVLGANVQYVTGGPVDFANGLNVGPIQFN
jgi:hypothetical protein